MSSRSRFNAFRALVPIVAAVVALTAAAPTIAIDVTLATWTGNVHFGRWHGVDDGHVRIELGSGEMKALSLDELMSAAFEVNEPFNAEPPGTTFYFVDGAVLFGTIVGASADAVEADCRWAGRVGLPIKSLAAIRFQPPGAGSPQEVAFRELLTDRPVDRDVMIAVAGETAKTARGVLDSITETSVTFQWNDQMLNVSHERCYAIVLARGVDRSEAAAATLRLRDGSVVAGEIRDGDNATLAVRTPFADRIECPLREVSSIAWTSPNVTFADALEPARYEFTPYVYGDWPWRRNRSAMNTPIRLDGRAYERGIGMRCGGSLTYATEGRFGLLAATIGIDDAVRPRGEVIFRVLADESEVFNSGPIQGTEAARRISVDVSGAKQVTLVVDVGRMTDVGGCADWAAARFIRGATQ